MKMGFLAANVYEREGFVDIIEKARDNSNYEYIVTICMRYISLMLALMSLHAMSGSGFICLF